MKLQFKDQKFQTDASQAVVDVFFGQPYYSASYMMNRGYESPKYTQQQSLFQDKELSVGFCNHPIIPSLTKEIICENLNKVQALNQIERSEDLIGEYNLTVEMETGTGKTYTYIKTMYELNKHYGWTKFIVVVPTIAIREGVYKTFSITQEYFAEKYGKKIKFFIYNSARLNDIEHFACDGGLNVMIINSQAFNARGKDARRIYMKLDSFRSRRPIDVIAKTNPILIIDEPQSVEGAATNEKLKDFKPLVTLRYSATPKERYNLVYKLDAQDAYNRMLVKKIAVKGITVSGSDATGGYVYVQSITKYKDKSPTATIQFDCKGANGIKKITRTLSESSNLYDYSNNLDEYKNRYVISKIDGRDNTVSFLNGHVVKIGSLIGDINEEQIRRVQIRETILSHIERERKLFSKGIKVLSLFFIDEVAKYKQYDNSNNAFNGIYADMFEEEYENILSDKTKDGDDEYIRYLKSISAKETHAGYFSIDKKGRIINTKEDKKEGSSTDVDAFDLIMKNKERLLSFEEPVRFIFSHSALREGWDNPNVFQICTLKKSCKDDKKRQEIGRGLRLCVNQKGERMDYSKLGDDVQNVNVLTVIANESYADFTASLQSEIAEVVTDRPKEVNEELFTNRIIIDTKGNKKDIDPCLARSIYHTFVKNDYINTQNKLTDAYYDAKKSGKIIIPQELIGYEEQIIKIVDSIYNPNAITPENLNESVHKLHLDREKLNKKEFQELWKRINSKTAYVVNFDTNELIQKSIESIDTELAVTELGYIVRLGSMGEIESKQALNEGVAFDTGKAQGKKLLSADYNGIKYDLVGKIVEGTQLTRKSVIKILQGIKKDVFDKFKLNPEEFIVKVSNLINDAKATVIIEHIQYNKLQKVYETDIFTEPEMKNVSPKNSISVEKHLYDYLIYDSEVEKKFGEDLDNNADVSVYVKLPKGFYINTPVGRYNPDWAIAFNEENVKHIWFIAETKGSMQTLQLKAIEKAKIKCAKEHFKAISADTVQYGVVSSYEDLLKKVM